MITRPGLWLKILLVAFLNVFLLLACAFVFARIQLRLDLSSFLLAPARYRILSISRLAALELPNLPQEKWSDLLAQYSNSYPADFFLFDRDGTQLAGKAVHPPTSLFQRRGFPRERFPRGGFPRGMEGERPPPPPREPPSRDPPAEMGMARGPRDPRMFVEFEHTTGPSFYWASVRVPLSTAGQPPLDARLVWRFDSLWTNSFFFEYKPLAGALLLLAGISLACWVPLIRSLTQTVSAMTKATGQIAEGHFEVALPVKRRDELGRLSESINQMANRLSGYVNGQRRFLGDIAHELCSPVARIQLSLGILQQRANESTLPYVETIDEEVQHMSTLVNELLSFSKASLGASAALENVNLATAIRRAVEREKTEGVEVTLDVPASLAATAQPDYLFRSVSNVLRNAIRYAGNDGPIEITARQIGDFAVINVSDHGPGVAPAELDEILKPFYRPETARQRETGGVGLGLAIVRTCMEACGGSVTCRNRSPKGFEVDLRLPVAHG